MALLLPACSVAYMEKDGTRYIFGPAVVRIAEVSETSPFVDPAIEIRTFGLTVLSGESGTGVSLGWARLREGRMRDSAPYFAERGALPSTSVVPVSQRFVWTYLRLPPAASMQPDAGTVGEVATAGLALTFLGHESQLNLGYGRVGFAEISENVAVAGNPLQLLERQFASPPETRTGGQDD